MLPRPSTQKKPWLESRDISHLRYRLCGTSAADATVPAPRMPRLRRAQTALGDHCYYDGVRPSVRGGSAGKKVLTRPPATVFELHTYLLTVAPFPGNDFSHLWRWAERQITSCMLSPSPSVQVHVSGAESECKLKTCSSGISLNSLKCHNLTAASTP